MTAHPDAPPVDDALPASGEIENADHWRRPWHAVVNHRGGNRSCLLDADDNIIMSGLNNEKAALFAAFANADLARSHPQAPASGDK